LARPKFNLNNQGNQYEDDYESRCRRVRACSNDGPCGGPRTAGFGRRWVLCDRRSMLRRRLYLLLI
jgi:hypothetical protein